MYRAGTSRHIWSIWSIWSRAVSTYCLNAILDVYFMAKVLSELPFYILFPSIMVCISYYMIGLYDDAKALLMTVAILVLITNVTTAFGKGNQRSLL